MTHILKQEYGIDARERNPWYFPSIGEYSQLLERQGFLVRYAHHFDRPTKLQDGNKGLHHWLTTFCDDFFQGISDVDKQTLFLKLTEIVKQDLFQNGSIYADYKRLMVVAVKL